ncbi:MAG: TRAP transporter substrate-binding protein DctP [Reyranellaceae bacterium]
MTAIRTLALTAMTAALIGGASAQAAEMTLKGVSCFPEKTYYSERFEDLVKRVNERGKGVLQIRYLGGAPKVMPPFDVGKNLKDGVIDITGCTAGFYQNLVPEIDAMKMVELPVAELHKNGAIAYLDKLHNEKMNAHYLGLLNAYGEFHLYLNKKIEKPDLTGMKIRVSPLYRAMVEKMGGTAVASAPADIYTMMERGTVDGFGWPVQGIFDFSWQKVTKYRVDPGFYRTEMEYLVNLDVWKKMDAKQTKLLEDVMAELEKEDVKERGVNERERKKQEEAGMVPIRFSPEDEKKYIEIGREAAWESIIKASPEHGPKLRKLLTGK